MATINNLQKYIFCVCVCSAEERNLRRFGAREGWENNDNILIIWWTIWLIKTFLKSVTQMKQN